MEWDDEGIVLSARKHGESALIASLLTREHGRHPGLVRGGAGSRARGLYQPGNRVAAHWRGRLAEHLGSYRCELARSTAAGVLDDALALAVLRAACAVTDTALPERHPYGRVYETLAALLEAVRRAGAAWSPIMCAGSWICSPRSATASTSAPAPRPAATTIWPMSRPRPAAPCRCRRASLIATGS